MPIFEYECSSCGERFEVLIRSNSDEVSCPKCKSKEIKKLFSSFGFQSSSCSSCSASTCSTCNK